MPLDPQRKEIRVLDVRPGGEEDPLQLDLSRVSLHDKPSYSVLSYCWGPQTDLRPVRIGDTSIQISEHLHKCLISLRRKDSTLTIWIDAICINQLSNQEKSSQVPLMKDIYKSTEDTFVWLGDTTPRLSLIFDSISRAKQSNNKIIPERIEQIAEELLMASPDDTEQAFSEFVNLAWFHRTWIIQELALPRTDPIFVCGNHCAPWTDTKRWWDVVRSLNRTVMQHNTLTLQVWKNIHLLLRFRALESLAQLRELFVNPMVFKTGLRLSALISISKESVATDPRDKIYGVMGLANLNANSKIIIDYEKSTEDLFEEASRYLIFEEGSLSILSNPSVDMLRKSNDPNTTEYHELRLHRGSNVDSSWIRDFAHTHGNTHRPEPLVEDLHPRRLRYNASLGTSPTPHSDQDKGTLSIAGIKVDVVKEQFRMWYEFPGKVQWFRNLSGGTKMFLQAGRQPIADEKRNSAAAKIEQGGRGDGETYPWHLLYQPRGGPTQPIREAIWRTFVGDKSSDSLDRAPEYYDIFFGALLDVERGANPTITIPDDALPPEKEPLDQWYAYQRKVDATVFRRAAFSTEDGWIGLGPDTMRKGDVIAILSGGDVPFVLRPTQDGHTLVGECYVEGIMYGEILKGQLEAQSGDNSKSIRGQMFNIR
ncbi:Heterokaryon incompatibility protein 6, OR allele 4 [Colletotrichum chlorophyti]|uniref:Heterokaryon incompatibility protein 6, OR allele 4 n=1 Tax=Colletotrichum chlorophyti TaxID=708187 RepID=A0A1Q8S5M9_9PEZI|nr:Heterokaryon incompatibility protein 6, OR allele 4 [Colletotrichum chlorophyti]